MNPYMKLKMKINDFLNRVYTRERTLMFTYMAVNIESNDSWRMYDLRSRVTAAEQLGYSVLLRVNDKGDLQVWYEKKLPKRLEF